MFIPGGSPPSSVRSRTLVVEFFGLPGSGKTTLCERISSNALEHPIRPLRPLQADELSALCRPPDASMPDLLLALRTHLRRSITLASRPTAAALLVDFLLRSPRRRQWKLRLGSQLVRILDAYRRRAAFGPDRALMLDEGLYQKAIGLFLETEPVVQIQRRSRLRCYLRGVPQPNLLVYLDLPPAEAACRCRERPQGRPPRLRHLTERDFEHALLLMREIIDDCLCFALSGPPVVLHLDATDLDEAANAVDSQLSSLPALSPSH